MTYQQTLDYLFSRLPMYQRKGKAAYKPDLKNILSATEKLNNPQKKFKSIHIAGTNGKGSTSHMIASVLQECGYNVGLYTSPHLKDFRERIKINGKMINKEQVIQFVAQNKVDFEEIDLSFFEFTVALAFNYFAKQKVDIAIIEVGLGGRLDSTNIINPELSIITNVALDHTNILGDTIEEIAKEKGGIIKKNTAVIIGRKQAKTRYIFQNISDKKNAVIIHSMSSDYSCDLKGNYQFENINTATTAILELQKKGWKITRNNIKKGLLNTINNTGILGRWQILGYDPLIICDIGHNDDGIKQVVRQIMQTPHKTLHVILGFVNDKDIDIILGLLPKDANYYFCKANIARAMDARKLKSEACKHQLKGNSFSSVKKALNEAKKQAKNKDLIFIGGSTFVIAEVV